MPPKTAVSVVIPAWKSSETIVRCLESLRRQRFRDFEVILVDSSPDEQTANLARAFPEVQLVRSPHRLWPHAARNLGATMASGEILVFSDPDCVMSPQWLESLVTAHRDGHRVVGGSVGNARAGWWLDGIHLCKYAWWLPGGRPGTRPELPSANVSYSRSLFGDIGPFREEWCGDTLLAYRAAAAGSLPWFEPSAHILHDHRTSLGAFLRERFQRGYDYGRVRPELERWHVSRTLASAAAAPLVVVSMLVRAYRYAASAAEQRLFLRSVPILLAGYTARQSGEAIAQLTTAWSRRS